jgi:hypothetical protein
MPAVWLDERDCLGGVFPDVCLKCGQPAPGRVRRTFTWMPGWVYLTLLAHLFVFLIVALIVRKSQYAEVPMCDRHHGHWFWRYVLVFTTLVGAVAGVVGLIVLIENLPPGADTTIVFVLGIPAVLLAWFTLALVAGLTAIRPLKISQGGMKLTGVCQEFVSAYTGSHLQRELRFTDVDRAAAERWSDRGARRPREDEDRYHRDGEDEPDTSRRRQRYREE